MKRINAIALFAIVTLATSTGLVAQDSAVKANIPFNFTVRGTAMPAGEYTITPMPSSHMIKILSADRQHEELALTYGTDPLPASGARLVFDRCGGYYFLRSISSHATKSLNVALPIGATEKRLRTQEAKLQTTEQVLVAAR
jgi:hypothetical protein